MATFKKQANYKARANKLCPVKDNLARTQICTWYPWHGIGGLTFITNGELTGCNYTASENRSRDW